MNIIRSILFFCPAFLLPLNISGQTDDQKVIAIPEIIVREKHSDFFSDDQTTICLPESAIELYRQQSLGIMLSYESPALVRSYGSAGSLISLSIHGTSTNHTSVTWNGFPLNSPSSGQADLSLIPSGFVQSVEIVNSASGALYGSGTFGGLVELDNRADWKNKFSAVTSGNMGSFGTGGFYTSIRAGNSRIQYNIAASNTRASNDFVYRDIYMPGSPETRIANNSYTNKGIIQNIYVNAGKGHYFEAGAWLQGKMKELPPVMGSFDRADAIQNDRISRVYLNYNKTFLRSSLTVKSAYLTDYLHYTDKINHSDNQFSIDSEIETGRTMGGIEYRHDISAFLTAGGGGSFVYTGARTNNYFSKIREDEYAVYGNLKLSLSRLIMNASLRHEFYEGIDPVLQFSAGLRIKVNNKLVVRTNFSNKFRKPTLNEKYWRPGGNPYLRPEKGWGADVSAELELTPDNSAGRISILTTAYLQSVDNWIQWVMRDSLTPAEYKGVLARGAEAVVNFSFPLHYDFYFKGSLNYGFNFSAISEIYGGDQSLLDNQLVYVPRHIARVNLVAGGKGFRLGCYGSFTGERETVESADPWLRLPSYFLFDVISGYDRKIMDVNTGILFRVENIFNTRYEVMRSYPMPGRAFYITLKLDISKL